MNTQYTAAGVIDAVRLELQNSTSDADSAFEDGFSKGAKWALANVEGRMRREASHEALMEFAFPISAADDLFRVMCDELTVMKELRAKLAAAEEERNTCLTDTHDTIADLRARIKDLKAALKPFAEWAKLNEGALAGTEDDMLNQELLDSWIQDTERARAELDKEKPNV